MSWYRLYTPPHQKVHVSSKSQSKLRKLGHNCAMKLKENPLNPPVRESPFYPLKREGTLVKTLRSRTRTQMLDTTDMMSETSSIRGAPSPTGDVQLVIKRKKVDLLMEKPRLRWEKIQTEWDRHVTDIIPLKGELANSVFGFRMHQRTRIHKPPMRLPSLGNRGLSISLDNLTGTDSPSKISVDLNSLVGAPTNTPAPEHELSRPKRYCLCARCRERMIHA